MTCFSPFFFLRRVFGVIFEIFSLMEMKFVTQISSNLLSLNMIK